MRGFGLLTVLALAVLLVPPVAHAANKKDAKERTARKACLSGNYDKGVEILSDLFIDTKDPNYIFNQGRCLEQNSRFAEAISRFREYLRKVSDISPTDKADTEKHIADCQALLAPKEGPAAPAASAPEQPRDVAVPVPMPPPAYASPQPAPEQVAMASNTPANPGRGLHIAGIACGAAGVASLGTAIYFYTRAKSYSDKVAGESPRISSDEQAGKNAETMQWVFYTVGAAAIATSTLLYVLGWPSADAGHAAAGFAPLLGPGVAGISAQGAF